MKLDIDQRAPDRANSTRWAQFPRNRRRWSRAWCSPKPICVAANSSRSFAATPGSSFARTRSATRSRAGRAWTPSSRRSERAPTSTQFPMRAGSMAPSACSAVWRRFAPSLARATSRDDPSNWLSSPPKSPRVSASDAWEAGCLSGLLDPDVAAQLKDRDGVTLDEARSAADFDGPLSSVRLPPGFYSAFVELHIEQGPFLERHNIPIGVVTAIAAPASLRITIEGEGGHAGAVLMPDRHDAFLAAAEIALGGGSERAIQRLDRHGRHRRCVRDFPGRRQQHSQPRAHGNRRARHRLKPGAMPCCKKSKPHARRSRSRRGVTVHIRTRQRRSSGPVRSARRGRPGSGLRNARPAVRAHDQPRLSRFAVHVAHRADGNALHPLPRRSEPSARRIRVAGSYRAGHPGAG